MERVIRQTLHPYAVSVRASSLVVQPVAFLVLPEIPRAPNGGRHCDSFKSEFVLRSPSALPLFCPPSGPALESRTRIFRLWRGSLRALLRRSDLSPPEISGDLERRVRTLPNSFALLTGGRKVIYCHVLSSLLNVELLRGGGKDKASESPPS